MHTAANFFFRRLKYLENIKLNIAKEDNNKDQIFIKFKAYKLCLVKAIKKKENEAFINLELEKRSNILKGIKKRIRKL